MQDIKIEVVPVEPEQIGKFTSEDEFMKLSVRLLVETASYVCVAALMQTAEAGHIGREFAF